jgi:hypothetical protein
MKKIIISILIIFTVQSAHSQASNAAYTPGYEPKNCRWGCPVPLDGIVNESELIFEGRVIFDSTFVSITGEAFTYHRVLVLKEFKGDFKSDTIQVMHLGGSMGYISPSLSICVPNIHTGNEAVFCVAHSISSHDIYSVFGQGCGFVNVCDKKDVVSEVYEPIEKATGQGYVDVHPNTCATQKQKK